jgi:hypothetical protein
MTRRTQNESELPKTRGQPPAGALILAFDLIGSMVSAPPSSLALSTCPGPQRTAAPHETSIKLGCGSGPIAPGAESSET